MFRNKMSLDLSQDPLRPVLSPDGRRNTGSSPPQNVRPLGDPGPYVGGLIWSAPVFSPDRRASLLQPGWEPFKSEGSKNQVSSVQKPRELTPFSSE